jgi:F-type H+-transporting ATPase subunit b
MFLNTLSVYAAPVAAKATEKTAEAVNTVEEAGRSGLGLNLVDIAFYLLCFVIAMLVLNNVLFKPLTKLLDERAARIDADYDKMEEMEAKITNADNQAKSILAQAYADGRAITEEAKNQVEPTKAQILAEAEMHKAEMLTKANQEADKIVSNSRATAEKEILVLVQKTIQKATSNLKISGSAQNEILGSIVNSKL